MKKLTLSIIAAAMLATPALSQAKEESPVYRFLKAADEGRTNDLAPLLSKSGMTAAEFTAKTSNCYLRRVYGAPGGAILAAWMCDEGAGKSRVFIADVANADDGVRVTLAREVKNDIAAPARQGSALAEEKTNG